MEPVSYTHLDVYKRQLIRCSYVTLSFRSNEVCPAHFYLSVIKCAYVSPSILCFLVLYPFLYIQDNVYTSYLILLYQFRCYSSVCISRKKFGIHLHNFNLTSVLPLKSVGTIHYHKFCKVSLLRNYDSVSVSYTHLDVYKRQS